MAAIRGRSFKRALRRVLRQRQHRNRQAIRSGKDVSVLPKRWIVERTFAWLNRCRRLAKDWECLNRKALAFLAGLHPAHVAKAMPENNMISDKL